MEPTTKSENAPIAESPATLERAKSTTFSEEARTENSSTSQATYSPYALSATTEPPTQTPSRKSYKDDMDIEAIAIAIEGIDLTPKEIADHQSRLSAWYARKRVQYGRLEALSARYFATHRGGYKTVAEVERAWQATPEGQQEITLKRECEAIDRLIDAVRTQWFLIQSEAKNTI